MIFEVVVTVHTRMPAAADFTETICFTNAAALPEARSNLGLSGREIPEYLRRYAIDKAVALAKITPEEAEKAVVTVHFHAVRAAASVSALRGFIAKETAKLPKKK